MEDKSNEKVNTEALKLLAEYPMNLSDFALFLSVMKIKSLSVHTQPDSG